jgi:hypothetical protein
MGMSQMPRQANQQNRWPRAVTVLLWTVVLAWLIAALIVAVNQAWGYDVRFFWASARTFLDGGDPFVRFHSYPGVDLSGHTQFVGLPWVTLLTVPFALLPFESAARAWTLYNAGLLLVILAAVYLLGRKDLASWQLALLILCSLWLGLRCLVMGQIGLLVTAAVLLGVISLEREKWVLGGLCFSLTLFKPWVAVGVILILAILVLVKRKWHFFFGALAGGLGILALTTIVWPGWFDNLAHVDFAFAYGVKAGGSYVVYWPVATLTDFATYILGWSGEANRLLFGQVLLIGAITILALRAIYCLRQGQTDTLLLLGTGALLSALMVPYIRFYDYVILSVWAVGIFIGGKRSGASPLSLGIAAILVGLAFVLNLGAHPEPWVYQILLWMYMANTLVLWSLPPARDRGLRTDAEHSPVESA